MVKIILLIIFSVVIFIATNVLIDKALSYIDKAMNALEKKIRKRWGDIEAQNADS